MLMNLSSLLKLFIIIITVSIFDAYSSWTVVYCLSTMDDKENNTSNVFTIFFTGVVSVVVEIFYGGEEPNYTVFNRFNQNCTNDMDCYDIALYCNLTIHLCQCAGFFSLNKTSGVCEIQYNNLMYWVKHNGTDDGNNLMAKNSSSFALLNQFIPMFKLYWIIISTMTIAVLCMCACAVYACIGDKDEDNNLSVVSCNGNEVLHKIEPTPPPSIGKY